MTSKIESIGTMELPRNIEGWRQICDQRIENIKSKETRFRELNPPSQCTHLPEKFHVKNKNLAPELCAAIRRKDVFNFLSVLEQLSMSKGLQLSSIIDQVSRSGNTLLHLAANFGSQEILHLIADHFPKLILKKTIKGDTALHVAAKTQNPVLIKIIMDSYTKHYANKFYEPEEEELWRIRNEYGNTALHEAVMMSNVQGTGMLFSIDKAVTHYLNKEGKSPLYLAVETGNTVILNLLLEAPFNDCEMHEGNSPLHAALLRRNLGERVKHSVSQPLIEGWLINQATPRSRSFERQTKLQSDKDLLEDLVKKRPYLIYLRDQKGGAPLHCAASIGHIDGVRTLLNADPHVALEWNSKGRLPIHVACKNGHVDVVNEFVQKQWFDPMDSLDQKGQNILHIAAKNGKDKVVKYILQEKKFNRLLNEKDKNGNTSLHLASKYLHPKVLLLLTQDKRLDINLVNNKGLTARDIILLQRKVPPTTRELLSLAILYSVGAPLSEQGRRVRHWHTQLPQIEWIKDRISTLLLVAILVAIVTFAAGFTIPGGVNSLDDLDIKKRGMAIFLDRKMFQLFTICDVIAMYSSSIGSFILLWAQLGDFYIAFSATYFALYLVGLALVTMSIAFMAAVHLVVSNLSWLANIVMAMGIIFLLMFMVVYIVLIFPLGARPLLLRSISYFIFRMIIPFSESYGKLPKKKKKTKESEQQLQKDETRRVRIDMPETQH